MRLNAALVTAMALSRALIAELRCAFFGTIFSVCRGLATTVLMMTFDLGKSPLAGILRQRMRRIEPRGKFIPAGRTGSGGYKSTKVTKSNQYEGFCKIF